ncbi:DUF4166 domain-containing protein [Ruegeria halocynthiae]|uniref:DUF4166 domain-containing protein n=1 Tax=Ruegeria halocynthiae TaxID=985054 RepID=UPI00055F388A|nr:DUF4166 domain-containing protein [Ruegeria halocynthiae]
MHVRPVTHPDLPLVDHRFSDLLGQDSWMRLPATVRRRFGKRVRGGASVTYQGVVTNMQMNWAGWTLAQLARLIGAPLPYDLSCVGKPAVVIVTEDIAGNGQFWIRQYGRASGFPQMIHSSKRFSGATGIEEYIGYGIGMGLRVVEENGALLFKSDHYFLSVFGKRIKIPKPFAPGALVIGHHDLGSGRFRFSMRLRHALLGTVLSQDAEFQDAKE